MSQRSMVHAAFAAAGLLGFAVAANADEAFSIDADAIQGCLGDNTCELAEADITTIGGTLENKILHDATGFGVSDGASGGEIDLNQHLLVDFGKSRTITAIQILFIFNGPEYNDRAEKAQVTADDVVYTLSTLVDADDGSATFKGPGGESFGTVTKCTEFDDPSLTLSGTGCFVITDPFPGVVSRLDFTAIEGSPGFPGGADNNESDYSIGYIDVAAAAAVDLAAACANPSGCPVAAVDGKVAAELNSVNATNTGGGSTHAIVTQVKLPDCRYIPHVCLALLQAAPAPNDNAARAILIGLGVIKPLDPSGPNKLNPAAQLLNVKSLLPPEVISQFGPGSVPPAGLPPLYIGSRWRGQASNEDPYWFDGLFFKTDPNVVFSGTFEGSIDVLKLTGQQLGCFTNTSELLAWDVITSVSELAKSTGGRFIDTVTNVDCENPTKVSGTRLSLYTVNFEVVPTTYGPTIKSFKPKITVNNDAVFARLVQSLWSDLGESRANYACKQADPAPAGGVAPLSKPVCNTLKSRWVVAEVKLNLCVAAAFFPASSYRTWACNGASDAVAAFEAALPATATGQDPYNRLGELKSRVDVFQHVWTGRFLNSLQPGGFCREWGNC